MILQDDEKKFKLVFIKKKCFLAPYSQHDFSLLRDRIWKMKKSYKLILLL